MSARVAQYTLRNVSPAVDRALRRRARELGRSLNAVALEALAAGAGVSGAVHEHEDLDGFIGSWVEDRAVDRALGDQRRVDRALWK